jgi:hypothetical protein
MEIAKEIEALRQLAIPDLVLRYEELFGRPPRSKNREHMWKRCAWKLQEQRLGGLSRAAKDRLEQLIGEIDLPLTEARRTVAGALKCLAKPGDPPVGTILTRSWHGKEIQVKVVDGGFEYNGLVHKTLSAAAQAITGSHWNGRLFFGLAERKRTR